MAPREFVALQGLGALPHESILKRTVFISAEPPAGVTERAKALTNAASNLGIKVKDIYWTMGGFDAVLIAESPGDDAVMAFAASMGSLGNIRTQTLRAFSAAEMNKILDKVPAGFKVTDEILKTYQAGDLFKDRVNFAPKAEKK